MDGIPILLLASNVFLKQNQIITNISLNNCVSVLKRFADH